MKKHVLIVKSQFYRDIEVELSKGTTSVLADHDITYEEITVPGVFEIPAAISFAIKGHRKYDGYIALGCVIRGETTHYDYVCSESARGLMDLSTHCNAAIGYGILTVENKEQAMERALETKQNKGATAAYACMNMIKLKKHFCVDD